MWVSGRKVNDVGLWRGGKRLRSPSQGLPSWPCFLNNLKGLFKNLGNACERPKHKRFIVTGMPALSLNLKRASRERRDWTKQRL